jgi:enamine deaminase RidA (YjgF/YER057c/UK114 family)
LTFFTGIPLERDVGYCRMIKIGSYIRIGGTAAVNTDGTVHAPGDVYLQTKFIMERFLLHLRDAGACATDVFSIRGFTVGDDANDFERGCADSFGDACPVVAKYGVPALLYRELCVEAELEAFIGARRADAAIVSIGPWLRITGVHAQARGALEGTLALLGGADVYAVKAFTVGDEDAEFERAFEEIFAAPRPLMAKYGVAALGGGGVRVSVEVDAVRGERIERFGAGRCQMVRIGRYVRIGGTTALRDDGKVEAPGDDLEQVRFILRRFCELLETAGAKREDVYALSIFPCGECARCGPGYSEYFGKYTPLLTGVGIATLYNPDLTLAVELEAVIGSGIQ